MDYSGGCLCGGLRYRIERKHLNAVHCYCAMCRKAHGTAFSTHVVVKPGQLHWVEQANERDRAAKEPNAVLVPYESSPNAYRKFCSGCGTHLLVHGQSGDNTLAIPAGTLDGDPALTILGHMFTAERVNWYRISDDYVQHDGWPPGFGGSKA